MRVFTLLGTGPDRFMSPFDFGNFNLVDFYHFHGDK